MNLIGCPGNPIYSTWLATTSADVSCKAKCLEDCGDRASHLCFGFEDKSKEAFLTYSTLLYTYSLKTVILR